MLSNKSSLQMEGAKTMVHVGLRFAWNSLLGVAKTLLLLVLFSIVYIYILDLFVIMAQLHSTEQRFHLFSDQCHRE